MDDSQLKWLMDYTLFHIGAYITLSTLLVALLGLEGFKQRISTMKWFLFITLVCFVAAGVCGGVVASNIPYFNKFEKLRTTDIGPFFDWPMRPLVWWTSKEHLVFWAGVFSALLGVGLVAFKRRKPIPTAAETAELSRRLAKDCFDAATNVRSDDAIKLQKIADDLLQLANAADKSDSPA